MPILLAMLKCKYKHLLDPGLYNNVEIARFLDALSQPEIEVASCSSLQYFINHIPALDDVLDHLYLVEARAYEELNTNGIVRPHCSILAPCGEMTYHIQNLKKRNTNPTRIADEISATCKAIAFCNNAHSVLMTYPEEMLDRVKIVGNCIRGTSFESDVDIVYGEIGAIKCDIKRNIGRRSDFHFYEIKNSTEMLAILQKVLTMARLLSIENLPQLNEHEILLNFAVSMKSLDVFSQ